MNSGVEGIGTRKDEAFMSVDTKTVPGRRKLSFNSLDDVVADAEACVSSPNLKMLGNWPLSRILAHLTKAMTSSVDGSPVKAPLVIRLIGPFLKGRILKKGMSPGLKLPKYIEVGFYPEISSSQEALENLRVAVRRLRTENLVSRHPVFGKVTPEEWVQIHLRHSELHLSFALPG